MSLDRDAPTNSQAMIALTNIQAMASPPAGKSYMEMLNKPLWGDLLFVGYYIT